MQITKEPKK